MLATLDGAERLDRDPSLFPSSTAQDPRGSHRTGALFFAAAAGAGVGAMIARKRAAAGISELRSLAATDDLTGLANRRRFTAALDRAIADAGHLRGPLSIALLDVDHFKRVNDVHGHGAGDEVLRALARRLAAGTRKGDLLARIGGEEFALLMPRTGRFQAHAVCERLRRLVAAQGVALPSGATCAMTLSTGLAEFTDGATAESLMASADAALYQAKRSGRNVIRLAA